MIRDAARSGAQSCDEIARACGAGTGCGGCRPAIEGLLEAERATAGISLPIVRAPERGV
jgi:bacterioferritin-associated ferredoxin